MRGLKFGFCQIKLGRINHGKFLQLINAVLKFRSSSTSVAIGTRP